MRSLPRWLSLVLGAVLALALLLYARTHWLIHFDEAAFGRETQGFIARAGGRIQCSGAENSSECVAAWRQAGSPPVALWLANSQLIAINRARPGDVNAPFLLHEALIQRGLYGVAYAEPNANLDEHALLWRSLQPLYRPKLLLLAICYDDLRDQGVRADIAAMVGGAPVAARGALSPMPATVQGRVEQHVVGWLGEHSALWHERPGLRSLLAYSVHTLRNRLVGIHATTKRPVDPGVYAQRMAVLEGLVADARGSGAEVLLYIPPYRRDIDGPYIEADYQRFKSDVAVIAQRHAARFADLDALVPGPEWATLTDALFGYNEPDFMHFTAAGHAKLAAALDAELRAAGH